MAWVNNLPYPGGRIARWTRRLLTGEPLYPDLTTVKVYGLPAEFREIEIQDGEAKPWGWLFRELLDFTVLSIYLHGSQADKRTDPFSDYDDIVIIDSAKISPGDLPTLIAALNRVDMHFCRLDPLQHHGNWIIEKGMLNAYDESYMPTLILKTAIAVKGPRQISYAPHLARSREGLEHNLVHACQSIGELHERLRQAILNLFELKALVGSFALVPAFIFQYRCEPLSKPDAIARAAEIFSPSALRCIAWASDTRENWGRVTRDAGYTTLRILGVLISNPHLFRIHYRVHYQRTEQRMISIKSVFKGLPFAYETFRHCKRQLRGIPTRAKHVIPCVESRYSILSFVLV